MVPNDRIDPQALSEWLREVGHPIESRPGYGVEVEIRETIRVTIDRSSHVSGKVAE